MKIQELRSKVQANLVYLPDEEVDKINPNYREHKNVLYELIVSLVVFVLGVVVVIVAGVHYGT